MPHKHTKNIFSIWHFRREITLGTLLHVAALLIMVTVTWSNLQSELVLIRNELTQLIAANVQLRQNIEKFADRLLGHEYRLNTLEDTRIHQHNRDSIKPNNSKDNDYREETPPCT